MTRKTLSNLLATTGLVVALTVSFGGTYVYGKSLTVNVSGLRSSKGVVHVLVYDDSKSFSENSVTDIAKFATKSASTASLSITLRGIKSGTYALMIHHDENKNSEFEYHGQLPLEGWAYSNNVGRFEVPNFDAASFTVEEHLTEQNIEINYAN